MMIRGVHLRQDQREYLLVMMGNSKGWDKAAAGDKIVFEEIILAGDFDFEITSYEIGKIDIHMEFMDVIMDLNVTVDNEKRLEHVL